MNRRRLYVTLIACVLATAALASAALEQGARTAPGRILDSGTVVRATTDTNQITGELAAPFRLNDAARIFIIPCSSCAVVQYPVSKMQRMDMEVSSSRASHIGLGALIGAGVGGVVGALLGANTKIEGTPLGAPAAMIAGAALGVGGGILGAVVGAILPTSHWERVLPRP